MKVMGYVATFIIIIFLSAIYSGFAASVIWEWFVVSEFGAEPLSIPIAIGLMLLVQFVTQPWKPSENFDDVAAEIKKAASIAIIKPSIYLIIGWIVTFWL